MEKTRTNTLFLTLWGIGMFVYIIATVVCTALKMSFAAIMWIPIVLMGLLLLFMSLFRIRKNKKMVYEKILSKERQTKYEQILLDIKDGTFANFLNKFSFKVKLSVSFRNEGPEIYVNGNKDDNYIEISFEKTYAGIVINEEETDEPFMSEIRYSSFKSVTDLYDGIVKEVETALSSLDP